MTKMFEVKKPVTRPEEPRETTGAHRALVQGQEVLPVHVPELPEVRKGDRQGQEAPFKVKVTEIEKDTEVQSLLGSDGEAWPGSRTDRNERRVRK